ncbi:MAG TPA: type IV toxin-antitoxin system AbiEi family antitoxin [Rhizomicrobium sp.]|jgi:predicted transcriptional regulator of viral defense system
MKPEAQNVNSYLLTLMQGGRYFFTSKEADAALGASRDAVKLALNRLRHKGEIASPARGLYAIVPPEYRSLGCLPADQFIPALLAETKTPYYAGLLTAAQYHGAAHHRPQEFQVMLAKARRPITCGRVRVVFHVRKNISDVPLQQINTPRGTVAVSAPAATAYDLVGYEAKIGGLDAVATILVELAEKLDPEALEALAPTVPLPWVQRLGYLLEHIGEAPRAKRLKDYVRARAHESAVLEPSARTGDYPRDRDWKLIVNANVEAET